MTISYNGNMVVGTGANTFVSSKTGTVGFSAAIGDLVVVVVQPNDGTGWQFNTSGLSDSAGNSWTYAGEITEGGSAGYGVGLVVFYSILTHAMTSGVSTITYTNPTGYTSWLGFSAATFKNVAASSPEDIFVTESSQSGIKTLSSGTPAENGELLIGGNLIANATGYNGASGWTLMVATYLGSHQAWWAIDYIIQTTKSSASYLPSYTGSSLGTATGSFIISFKPSGPAAPSFADAYVINN